MHISHYDGDDFAGLLRQCVILHTHAEPVTGVMTHTAEYLGGNVVLTELPGGLGGTLAEASRPGEVGSHEMARDALMRGLIDLPQPRSPRPAEPAQDPAGYIDLDDVPQDVIDALNTVQYVSEDIWAEELTRTRIIQTDEPTGHAIAHMGMRDDGLPIVLIQADSLFLIILPLQKP